jgi:hypothetical protein
LGDFYFLSYLGFLNPPQCTWVVYGISQFREQRSDGKPCVTRNEDEDHYLAPPNYRIIYVARGCAHVARVYILFYGGEWWRRWWAIESQLVIGHHPIHSDCLHYPSSIKTNWWMINGFTHVDNGHHGWYPSLALFMLGVLESQWGYHERERIPIHTPKKKQIIPCKKCEIPMHAKENIHQTKVHSRLGYCPLNN